LKTIGFNVTSIKIDPYMNIDAGTMAPTESVTLLSSTKGPHTDLYGASRHGEVFVLEFVTPIVFISREHILTCKTVRRRGRP